MRRNCGSATRASEFPRTSATRVFERFHRIEGTQARTYEGTGIGLALVQELIKLHGGQVRVESTVGEGSTFIVTIPLGTAHLPAERIQAAPSLPSTAIGADAYVEEALPWLPDAGVCRRCDRCFRNARRVVRQRGRPDRNT